MASGASLEAGFRNQSRAEHGAGRATRARSFIYGAGTNCCSHGSTEANTSSALRAWVSACAPLARLRNASVVVVLETTVVLLASSGTRKTVNFPTGRLAPAGST